MEELTGIALLLLIVLERNKMGRIGPLEIILILVIVLLLFGGKKIPELMKGLGRGVKEFKDASKKDQSETASTTETDKKAVE